MCTLNKVPMSALLVLAMLTCLGCREKTRRYAVSGTVSIAGKPLDDATIIFTPDGPGLAGAAEVRNGQFACTAKGGPSAGLFNVRLSPNQAEMEEVEMDISELATPRRPRVPLKYQRLGGLQVEITGEADQALELKLTR